MSNKTIALIGNPNVGKTVIFNELTGSRSHVANWPGVTVEKKTGDFDEIIVTDLPGIYSLTPSAVDDLVSRNYLIKEKPNLVVDILDATNLERNLYLGLLLKEMNVPVLFVLNMMDVAEEKKIEININQLSKYLKSPVLPTTAIKKKGINELKQTIKKSVKDSNFITDLIFYSDKIEGKIQSIENLLSNLDSNIKKNLRWYAIKLLENDGEANNIINSYSIGNQILDEIDTIRNEEDQINLASARYSYINDIIKVCVKKNQKMFDSSEFLDTIFLNKYLGIPIFLIIMWAMFEFTFRVATPLMTLIELIQEFLGNFVLNTLGESLFTSFIVDGIINGFGSIIIFLPNIFLMFFALSLLEDSGYLSRAAFVMDRLMYKIGLHGRSFVSMLLGFGCNVPAIMSTRAIESEEDRIVTIMANQNISCGARLPVYILIGGAVWGNGASGIIFSLYFLGILMAVLVALSFRKFVFKGERSPFILELGDYRAPTAKNTAIHMWERGREFIKKVGSIIFITIIVMWILQTFPLNQADSTESWLYSIGSFFQPLFGPLSFGVIAVVGIIFGFIAKEVVISAYGLMLGISDESGTLGERIFEDLGNNPVIAFSYLVFILLYTPCVAVIGAIKRETGSKKWAWVSVIYGLVLAYFMAILVQVVGGVYF